MASIDLSFLTVDTDFSDEMLLIRRSTSIDQYGGMILTETTSTIIGVVEIGSTSSLDRLPEGAQLSDSIEVYYNGILHPESAGGYADIIVWQGKRYQVKSNDERFNTPVGFTKSLCILEPATNV